MVFRRRCKKDVLEVLERKPLIGHPVQSKIPTNWFVFMKIPEQTQTQEVEK